MKTRAVAAAALVLGFVLPGSLFAADLYWVDAGTDDWYDGNNWDTDSGGGSPGDGPPDKDAPNNDNAYINNGGTAQVATSGSTAEAYYLYLGHQFGDSGTVEISDGTLDVQLQAYVGYAGTGAINQTGGAVEMHSLEIGTVGANCDGTYTITHGTLTVYGDAEVCPGGGTGFLDVDGRNAPYPTVDIRGELKVGLGTGTGKLRVRGTPTVTLGSAEYGDNGEWSVWDLPPAVSMADIHLEGSWTNKASDETKADFDLTHLIFQNAASGTYEVAGTMGTGFTSNFAMGKITVADGFTLTYADAYDNGNRGAAGKECLFTYALDIADDGGGGGGALDVWAYWTYVDGDVEAQLDAWITDGRLFSSLGPIDAIYVPCDDWTYVTPEPATLGLLALGGLGALLRRRKSKA